MTMDTLKKLLSDKTISFWFTIGFFAIGIAGFAAALAFSKSIHPETSSEVSPLETIRNVVLIVGGALAFGFAWWRAIVAERQADAARSQVETAQHQAETALRALSNERYQRGAEMLGSSTLAVRLGGIYALQQLATEHPDQYHIQVMRLLCAFVKNPTKDEILDRPLVIDGELMPTRIREDAQDALFAIGKRSWNQIQIEKREQFRVNLHGANLTGADLRRSNLDRANVTHAKLADADLEEASVKGACLVGANLTGANLDIASFTKSICRQARFTRVYASEADFSGADLEGTIWDNANLEGAQLSYSTLKGANLERAQLTGAHLIGTILGKGQRRMEFPVDASVGDRIAISYTEVQTWITQAQLDQANPADDCPPVIESGTTDLESDSPLVWQGGLTR